MSDLFFNQIEMSFVLLGNYFFYSVPCLYSQQTCYVLFLSAHYFNKSARDVCMGAGGALNLKYFFCSHSSRLEAGNKNTSGLW